MAWSILTYFIIIICSLGFLSSSTSGGRALAALTEGFCSDCETFANAIGVCGGTFLPENIEINGEYALQEPYAKCICQNAIQKVLWNCAQCERLAGHQSTAPSPQIYKTQCIHWGMTPDAWKAPYTGPIAPGTQADLSGGDGPNPTTPSTSTAPSHPIKSSNPTISSLQIVSSLPTSSKPNPKPKGAATTVGDGRSGPSSPTDSMLPSPSSDNSVNLSGRKESGSGLNMLAIEIAVGIVGLAVIAGVIVVLLLKIRRRRQEDFFGSHM
ncbi:hypothetical protein BGX28_009584 [Mortierella sp. GBA30]|nr:hypothetical protein BGX28_009584 [Mortierella sp. GBA30]